MEKSEKIYYIDEKNQQGKSNKFVVADNATIYWDPNTAYQTTEGVWISPATILAHETGHAAEFDKNPVEFNKNTDQPDADYKRAEERRNITTTEQRAARKHNEIKGNTVTRTNHKAVSKNNVSKLSPYEIEKLLQRLNEPVNSSK